MRVLGVFELQTQDGPCLDAYRTGERVEHEHLRAGTGRWPRLATVALQAGFRSAFALPLRLRDMTVGAMNLFHAEQTPMDERDVIVARAFADLAAISVLQHRAVAETQRINEQLAGALSSRIVIEQAKGKISERDGVDLTEAFNRLRNHARKNNLRLSAVAEAAIAGPLSL
jgi:GAF domain-containing protein